MRMPIRDVKILPESEEYLRRWETPPASPMLGVHRPLLERIAVDGIETLLDGQGGDELFGESPFLVSDRVRGGRVRSAAHLAVLASPHEPVWRTFVELGWKANLPSAAHRAARSMRPLKYAPHWLRPNAARMYVQEQDGWPWKRLDGPRWWAFLADQLTAHRERWGMHDYLRHKSALAGAEGRHPFLQDLDLIRLVLSLPPELAFDATLDRPLLRRSVAGIVPDEIRLTQRKPVFTGIFIDAMRGRDYDTVVSLLQPKAEIFAFVRPDAVERLFRATDQERRAPTWAWTLWRLAVCEQWLQRQRGSD
jgi:asparagine synthetase B (glutamine-hydrolysing)